MSWLLENRHLQTQPHDRPEGDHARASSIEYRVSAPSGTETETGTETDSRIEQKNPRPGGRGPIPNS